jgi:hypothetical protein
MGPRFFSCPARNVVTTLTGLSRLPIFYSSDLKFWHEKYTTMLFRTIFGQLYVIKQSAIIVPVRILRLYNKVDCAFRLHVPQISGEDLICRRHCAPSGRRTDVRVLGIGRICRLIGVIVYDIIDRVDNCIGDPQSFCT